jgi:hypothetical protein
MGAAELIVFKEVRARRFCYKNGLRLREGCLENVSHHRRHRFQMHAIPEMLNPPGKPIHCGVSSAPDASHDVPRGADTTPRVESPPRSDGGQSTDRPRRRPARWEAGPGGLGESPHAPA